MATAVVHDARPVTAPTQSPLALWHLLSLDAPSVAAVWTLFIAKAFAIRVSACVPLALATAVWMLYAADRISDALNGDALEERHRFHLRHRGALFFAMLCVLPLLTALIVHLPGELRAAWLLLTLPLLLYVGAVHALHLRQIPKEAVVGVFFGTATALPALILESSRWQSLLPSMLLFGALCWFNGIAISRWEPLARQTADAGTTWLAQRVHLAGWTLLGAALFALAFSQCRVVAVAVLMSTGLLLWLDRERARFNRVHLRALADAALLTPLILWPFLPVLSPR